MSQDLVPVQQHQPAPFGPGRNLASAVNVGAVSIEVERAIAEAQGQMTLAKRFPRDLTAAHAELMAACKSPAFAAVAFYAKPQGGSTVTGPSIRMAEQIAQVFGNFQYGHRELSRDAKKSEVEVFAWDMEKNNYAKRQMTVMHVRDTRDGQKPLRDQADIDMKINNVASKQSRGLILAMMPKWLVEDAVQECKKTIAGNNDKPLEARVRDMTQAFIKFGVTTEHLEKYLGHKLDKTLLDELVDLTGIYNSLKDGTPASEIFGADDSQDETPAAATGKAIAEVAKAGAAAKAEADKKAPAKPAAKAPVAAEQQEAKEAEPAAPASKPTQKNSKPVEEAAAPEPQSSEQQQEEEGDSAAAPEVPAQGPGDIF